MHQSRSLRSASRHFQTGAFSMSDILIILFSGAIRFLLHLKSDSNQTQPLSTTYCWLVQAEASSYARKTVNLAISSGMSLRLRHWRLINPSMVSGVSQLSSWGIVQTEVGEGAAGAGCEDLSRTIRHPRPR